jgi:hypothetical protein
MAVQLRLGLLPERWLRSDPFDRADSLAVGRNIKVPAVRSIAAIDLPLVSSFGSVPEIFDTIVPVFNPGILT